MMTNYVSSMVVSRVHHQSRSRSQSHHLNQKQNQNHQTMKKQMDLVKKHALVLVLVLGVLVGQPLQQEEVNEVNLKYV